MIEKYTHKNKRLFNNRGSMLLMAFYVSIILAGLGMAFVVASINEGKSAERIRRKTVALNIAEAGMERAIYDLRQDCVNDPNNLSWIDGNINGMSIGPDTSNYYDILSYDGNVINGGAYSVKLKNISGKKKTIWIKSAGSIGDATQTIVAFVKVFNINPWGNAVFVGSGLSGEAFAGNANIYGSVHLLSTSLSNSDFAIDLGGAKYVIGNNYSTLESSLSSKVPSEDTTVVNGETVSTLNADVWIKNGLAGLSGLGTIGESDVSGNSYKEQIDGIYNNDGYGGSEGSGNVYSDNGTANSYPLGDAVTFSSLSDSYTGYTDYQDYLLNNSLVLNSANELNEMANITPESNFNYNDAVNGYGSISMDGSGNLSISGKVYIDGGGLVMKEGTANTINYTGSGIILSEGNVEIKVNLETDGNNSFPNNILGIMTPGNITFNKDNINVMGLFYAEGKITIANNLDIVGSLMSNYIDTGSTSPNIYQVPDTLSSIPTGMIGNNTTCFMKVLSWQKQ